MKKIVFLLFLIYTSTSFAQKKVDIAQIQTPYGEILVWLYNETPKHKASFIQLAKAGYWDSLTLNRVIPNFVIQGGCPDTEEGFKDPKYLLTPEFDTTLKHVYGTFAAGRDDNPNMNSARCQFYIVQNKKGLPRLDKKYTVYGKVIKGMDVVDTIANVPRDKTDTPLKPVTLDVNIVKMKVKRLKELGIVIK
jgi:peptidyl-prolyl cis-trans isomerase B (cyclophilin B)